MIQWILINWQSLLIGSILLLGVVLIIKKMIKDKKSGKGCNCGCGSCPMSENCNKK